MSTTWEILSARILHTGPEDAKTLFDTSSLMSVFFLLGITLMVEVLKKANFN